jgi:SNF2 family DNA or RNA helicase
MKNYESWSDTSSKVNFLFELLSELKSGGHKVLIFSKTKILLNMIEEIMKEKHYNFVRLDGDVKIKDRDSICNRFNVDPAIFCFLLTSQVSGVGLTLTGANRAIVLDPDWNPANDNQSIDRCYRIGQKRDVIIYRLISTNTVEDKIYRRQVFKSSLAKATIEEDQDNMIRYFDEGEFTDLMKYDINEIGCETISIISNKHKGGDMLQNVTETPTNVVHLDFLDKLRNVEGVTNHGLLFSEQEEISPEDDEDL